MVGQRIPRASARWSRISDLHTCPRLVRQRTAPVLREMIRLLVPGLAEAADMGTVRRLVRARRSERSARQSESVKGEPRFRRRPRRRPLSAGPGLERWACRPSSPSTCATLRLASATPIASTAQDLQLLRLTLCLLRRFLRLLGLLRHTALLAMMRWRYRNSAIANRVHCAPITTAQRKKQRIRLTNGGQRRSAATHDGAPFRSSARAHRLARLQPRITNVVSVALKKAPSRKDFFDPRASVSRSFAARQPRRCSSRRRYEARRDTKRGAQKNFPPVGPIGRCADQNRVETSESVQVIRGARPACGGVSASEKRLDDAREPDAHRPSLRLSSSLTACGLARPPDARIT
jgi:hypothetical protein